MIFRDPSQALDAWESGERFVIFNGDCRELLSIIPDASVDALVTSPPYFMGKSYDRSYAVEDFYLDMKAIAQDSVRVIAPGRSMCWQVGMHVADRVVLPLDFAMYEVFRGYPDMVLRNRIVWHFGHGAHAKRRFSGRHETILWYTKGEEYEFNLDAVRVAQKYPGKRHYKGPNKGEFSGNPLGKNPGDVWEIPNVKFKHVEKTAHPCQFPIALVQRLIRALTPENGLVLDPFTGSGSAGLAAAIDGRRFIGCETSADFCEIAQERYDALQSGTLNFRPLDRDVASPDPKSAVATRPEHFAF